MGAAGVDVARYESASHSGAEPEGGGRENAHALAHADLVVDGRSADPRIPESDFRFTRFAEGDLLTTRFPYVGAGEMR